MELSNVSAKMILYEAFIESNSRFRSTSLDACMTCTSSPI